MNRLAKSLAAAAAMLALVGCGGESWSWNQKLNVEVDGPEGELSGASVIRYGLQDKNVWYAPPEARGASHFYSGEAVVLEASAGRPLFALLGAPNPFELFFPGEAPLKVAARFASLREARAVPPRHYPLLVTFGDIADPKSVRRVDPDDLDAAFGLCPDGTGLTDAEAPWRAAGMAWRRWARWQASGLSLDAYKEKYETYPREGWVEALDAKVAPRDRSHDCRRLKAMTLTITDEPVTEGRVEQALGRKPGDGSLDKIWRELSSEQRSMLSSNNWIKE